jgi:small subunit ribosomal protein S17
MQEKKVKTEKAVVVGRIGNKSIKVAIDYIIRHPKYGKYIKRRTTFSVHDELNTASVGDIVEIAQSRPYSRTKAWRLVGVLVKAVEK